MPYIFPCRLCSPMLTEFLPSVWGVSIIISIRWFYQPELSYLHHIVHMRYVIYIILHRLMPFSWSFQSCLHELSSYTYLRHLSDFSRQPLPKLSLCAILFDPLFILASNLLVLYPISKRGVCQKGSLLILGSSSPSIPFYERELSSWVSVIQAEYICSTSFVPLFILASNFLFHTSMPSLIPLLMYIL